MRAGLLRETISVRAAVSTARSTDGAPIVTYSTILADAWARVAPQKGVELYRDRNRWEVDETDFFIRYTTVSINPANEVIYNSDVYDIKAVINVDERNRELQLITKKVS